MYVTYDKKFTSFIWAICITKGSCKGCEYLSWVTNMMSWECGGRLTTAMVEWPPLPQLNDTNYSYTRSEFLSCVTNKMQCLVITLMNALCNRDYRGWNGVDFPECLVKEISTVRDTSWMAINLRSCDSMWVSYNDVLGKPMVSFGLVMCCCGGGGSKYYRGGVKILW